MPLAQPLILASGSPRRRELLSSMGVPFEVVSLDTEETCQGSPPDRVCELAGRKARAVSEKYPGRLILAADTLVAKEGFIFGKPESHEEALRMLAALSGCWHEVYTGVCLLNGETGQEKIAFDRTSVRFGELSRDLIERYVHTGEPLDKAGAYAIQGRAGMFVEEIRGSFSNVIGLPMALVRRMLFDFGVDVL